MMDDPSATRGRTAPIPLAITTCCVILALYGAYAGKNFNYIFSCLAAALATFFLECLRTTRFGEVAWWTPQILVAPWVALVIVPWTIRLHYDRWPVGNEGVLSDLSLPYTWSLNTVALIGFSLGSSAALRGGSNPDRLRTVDQKLVTKYFAVLAAGFLASFLVAGRPLGSFWRLSGQYDFSSKVDTRPSLGPLDILPTSAVIFVVVIAGMRRSYRRSPTAIELVALVVTAVVTLGSGARFRFMLLVIGWIIVQFVPAWTQSKRRYRPMQVFILCGVILGGGFLTLGIIGDAGSPRRAESSASTFPDLVETGVDSIDVVGSAELLVARGATPGLLGGRSYYELPNRLLPKAVVGDENRTPPSVLIIQDYLDKNSGYSAAYWLESALNFGRWGTFLFCAALAFGAVRILVWAQFSTNGIGIATYLLGPAVLFVMYQLLSRIATEQMLQTFASIVLGIWLGVRTFNDRCAGGGVDGDSDQAQHDSTLRARTWA